MTENDFLARLVASTGEAIDPMFGRHGQLKEFVRDQKLWYALFHTSPQVSEPMSR